jgi:predicted GIY-YIG superfamily endonuclease
MEILPKLRNPAPLRKAIYEIYYRQPVKDMIHRVVGPDDRPSGVYKVTFVDTGECYVGQSVDIGNRFMQHIRKGFGIDDYTNSKLYAAMLKHGLHKFKFEVVERCEEHLLNEKEKY